MHTLIASVPFDALTSSEALVPLLTTSAFWLVGAAAGLAFNAYLINHTVFAGLGRVRSELFGRLDALLASSLIGLFVFAALFAMRGGDAGGVEATPGAAEIVAGAVFNAMLEMLLITGILAALRLRGISWAEAFGFFRVGPLGTLCRAALLLFLAYPLITISAVVSEILLAASGSDDNSNQTLVDFFLHSDVSSAKWVVAVSAVIVAPVAEEFLFRGYIYGVVRRYGGITTGVLVNSALFALIHMHLPSFVPLFMLAVCLSLAYEWTGSLLVPMCMHAMFNSITVINLVMGKDY